MDVHLSVVIVRHQPYKKKCSVPEFENILEENPLCYRFLYKNIVSFLDDNFTINKKRK